MYSFKEFLISCIVVQAFSSLIGYLIFGYGFKWYDPILTIIAVLIVNKLIMKKR